MNMIGQLDIAYKRTIKQGKEIKHIFVPIEMYAEFIKELDNGEKDLYRGILCTPYNGTEIKFLIEH